MPQEWQMILLKRGNQYYSPEEWYHIVMFELFETNSCIGPANGFYGKKHSTETKKLLSKKSKEFAHSFSYEERKEVFGLPGELNGMYGVHRYGKDNPNSKKM